MNTRHKPRARRPPSPPGPLPPLPSGTDAILGPAEAAAALGLRPNRFNQLVKLGRVPAPDGKTPWNGFNFWRQSTINAYIESLVTKEPADAGAGD